MSDDNKNGRVKYLEQVILTLRAEEIKKAERIIQLEGELRELFDKDLKQHERLEQIRDIVIDDLKIARDSVSHYSRSQAFNDAIEETKRTFEKIKNESFESGVNSANYIDPEKEKKAKAISIRNGFIEED